MTGFCHGDEVSTRRARHRVPEPPQRGGAAGGPSSVSPASRWGRPSRSACGRAGTPSRGRRNPPRPSRSEARHLRRGAPPGPSVGRLSRGPRGCRRPEGQTRRRGPDRTLGRVPLPWGTGIPAGSGTRCTGGYRRVRRRARLRQFTGPGRSTDVARVREFHPTRPNRSDTDGGHHRDRLIVTGPNRSLLRNVNGMGLSPQSNARAARAAPAARGPDSRMPARPRAQRRPSAERSPGGHDVERQTRPWPLQSSHGSRSPSGHSGSAHFEHA